ncbi:O-antigen ligase family protein [Streptomyces sp. NPDC015220]|uniref:O-antigen ligase family protein n=1 Tax=Streptomyces sp. NPDC015220 TaxID=3364947 RepID=UPI003702DE12
MSLALTALPRRARALPPVTAAVAVVALLALPVTPGGAEPADVVSALMVLYCLVLLLRERRRPLSRAAAVVLGLPVVGLALAAMGASSAETGIAGLGRYLQVFVLVPAAVLLLIRGRSAFRLLAWSFVGLALVQGAIGVYQYLTRTGASYQGEDVRAVGTFGAQDVMGMATAVALGLVCAVGIALGRSSVRQRATAAGCALALLAPLAFSFSRGAWIATALACAVQLVLAGPRRALGAAAGIAAAAVVLVGGFGVGTAQLQERIDSIAQVADAPDQSVIDRYTLWASAVGMWRQHPLTGVGLKGFPEYRDGHATLALSSGAEVAGARTTYRRQPLLSPHNMYLLLLSEQGVLGLAGLAGSWLVLLVCGLRRLPGVRRHGPGLDCALVACGLLVWLLTDFVYGDIGGPSTVLTGLALGLAAWWALAGGRRAAVAARAGTPQRAGKAVAR